MMAKYSICAIDKQVNKNKTNTLETALKRVARHIAKHIDATFPTAEFLDWVDSDSEQPFRWNHNSYYWEQ